ncbi:MAG: hypothetical protein LBT47_03260 [Deltaproteobacteria bacterium]|jgi:hypothetical protein|nr:hypothetical protein [Deltaproteobacteria bacterium]
MIDDQSPPSNKTNNSQAAQQWRLDIRIDPGAAPELLARLLAEHPRWDLFFTSDGLAMNYWAGSGASAQGPWAAPELAEIKAAITKFSRGGRLKGGKTTLSWVPGADTEFGAVLGLGPFGFYDSNLETGQNRLALPQTIRLSPRLKTCYALALTAVSSFLTPPPGAPDTTGKPAMVLDECPVITALALLAAGAGPVQIVCSDPLLSDLTRSAASLNGFDDSLETVVSPAHPWPKALTKSWQSAFNLITICYSPYLVNRVIREAASWLAPGQSRMIVTGIYGGSQIALMVKAASRAGLSVLETSMEGNWSVMTLSLRRPSELPTWEWNPGDWLTELSEDESDALALAERLDPHRPPKGESGFESVPEASDEGTSHDPDANSLNEENSLNDAEKEPEEKTQKGEKISQENDGQ